MMLCCMFVLFVSLSLKGGDMSHMRCTEIEEGDEWRLKVVKKEMEIFIKTNK